MSTAFLKKIPLFSALDDLSLEELDACLKREIMPPNETIFWMDEKGDQLYIVEVGKVRISYTDNQGMEVTLSVLEPGAFFGELSLIDGGTHSATARCISEVQLLVLDRASFHDYLQKHPPLAFTMLEVLVMRLRANTARIQGVVNVYKELDANRNAFQRWIDKVAKALTSSTFLSIYICFIGAWIAVQVFLHLRVTGSPLSFRDEPPTFFILSFLITLTSFLLNILILNSQRRQSDNDRVRGDVEYQVNLKAQTEVIKLQLKMDRLLEMVNAFAPKEKAPD